jgi:hypothetical protein
LADFAGEAQPTFAKEAVTDNLREQRILFYFILHVSFILNTFLF